MNSAKHILFAAVAAALLATASGAQANTGSMKRTVAPDSPYRQKAAPPVASGKQFQIAPIKTAATPAPAPADRPVTHGLRR
jgi:hypothetical protein